MIKSYHSDIMKIYEEIGNAENEALSVRKAEVAAKVPEVTSIDKAIAKLCLTISMSSLKNVENRELYLKKLKTELTDLRIKKVEALVSAGYSQDYLSIHYQCPKCKDTGYIGNSKCSCYKQKLVKLYYKDSALNQILSENNFDNFNLNYYSSARDGENPQSARKNMEQILPRAMNFLKNFNAISDNLLFYGSSGTGKTFLSHCIAKDLLDRGVFVVYRTAEELIKDLRKIRFENDETLEELIVNCDLLIIDDLGTEQINEFSKTELFNILNQKLLNQKKMLVSTNYSLKELSSIYSERITSRLFGNFNLFKFYGDDIRVLKNLNSIK
ncbi:ATP-binding protein [Clostridium sp. 19966]|uniref:ATP-binding protein n=1 Tax=Clostridium sp. 19966 TaxID=2768166 RepID=UPI0028E08429|nr:ATP-binding protein [Clostridium sp. 19966]MDT8718672.1 ATP-binding protein [Clostridium sp. 19966]